MRIEDFRPEEVRKQILKVVSDIKLKKEELKGLLESPGSSELHPFKFEEGEWVKDEITGKKVRVLKKARVRLVL
jgi:hypothetical protein